MRIEPAVIAGEVRRGELRVSGEAMRRATAHWPDGDVVVVVRPAQRARSLAALAYYWGVVVEHIADHTGHTPDEVHELMKTILLPKHLVVADGNGEIVEDRVVGGSITALSSAEFAAYVDRVREYAAEHLDVVIPDPVQKGA